MFSPEQPEPEPTFTFIDFLPTVSLVPLLIGAAICYVVCLLSPTKKSLIPLGAGFYGALALYSIVAGALYTYVVFLEEGAFTLPPLAFRYWFWALLVMTWGHFAIRRSRNSAEALNPSPFIGGGGFILLGLGSMWGGLPGTLLMFAGVAGAVTGGVLFFKSARLMHTFGAFWVLAGLGATVAAVQQPFVAGFLLLFAELGLCFLLLIEHEVRERPVDGETPRGSEETPGSLKKKPAATRRTDFGKKFKQAGNAPSTGTKITFQKARPSAPGTGEPADKTSAADEPKAGNKDPQSSPSPGLSTEPGRHQGDTKVDPWTGAAIDEPEKPSDSKSSGDDEDEEDSIAKKYRLSDD